MDIVGFFKKLYQKFKTLFDESPKKFELQQLDPEDQEYYLDGNGEKIIE